MMRRVFYHFVLQLKMIDKMAWDSSILTIISLRLGASAPIYCHFISLIPSTSEWTRTLNLGMMRRVFYHFAAAAGQVDKNWNWLTKWPGNHSTEVEYSPHHPKVEGSRSLNFTWLTNDQAYYLSYHYFKNIFKVRCFGSNLLPLCLSHS